MELPIDARNAPFKPKYLDFETTLLARWVMLGTDINDGTHFINDGTNDIFKGLSEEQAKQLIVARKSFCDVVTYVLNGALMLLFMTSLLHAQTLTNADLGKKLNHAPAATDVYESLKTHEFHMPLTTRTISATTAAKGPSAGPWEFPEPRPSLRLDGTPLSQPPQVYGGYPWFAFSGSFFNEDHHQDFLRRSDRTDVRGHAAAQQWR